MRFKSKSPKKYSKFTFPWRYFLFVPSLLVSATVLFIFFTGWSLIYSLALGQSMPLYGGFALLIVSIPIGLLLASLILILFISRTLNTLVPSQKIKVYMINLLLMLSPFLLLFTYQEINRYQQEKQFQVYRDMITIQKVDYDQLDKDGDGKLDTIGMNTTITLEDDQPLGNIQIHAYTSCVRLTDGPLFRITNATIPSVNLNSDESTLYAGTHSYYKELSFTDSEQADLTYYSFPQNPIITVQVFSKSLPAKQPVIQKSFDFSIDPSFFERKDSAYGESSCPINNQKRGNTL